MGGGGLIQSILEKRTLTPSNFILEQQTVFHMKAEVFCYPIEVAEVEIGASGGRQSGRGQGIKKLVLKC